MALGCAWPRDMSRGTFQRASCIIHAKRPPGSLLLDSVDKDENHVLKWGVEDDAGTWSEASGAVFPSLSPIA